jgi:hypothetical protein
MPYQAITPMLAKWFIAASKPYAAATREPEWDKGLLRIACKPLSLLVAGARFDRCLAPTIRFSGLR